MQEASDSTFALSLLRLSRRRDEWIECVATQVAQQSRASFRIEIIPRVGDVVARVLQRYILLASISNIIGISANVAARLSL